MGRKTDGCQSVRGIVILGVEELGKVFLVFETVRVVRKQPWMGRGRWCVMDRSEFVVVLVLRVVRGAE